MFHNAAIQGRMTPRFGGGSLSSQTYMRSLGRGRAVSKLLTTAK